MPNIRCIDAKSYNLTVGTEYPILQETESRYTIENDNDATAHYAKSLFELVPDIPPLSIFACNKNRNSLDVMINETRRAILEYNDSRINASCGIRQITNIASIKARINNTLTSVHESYGTEENIRTVLTSIFNQIPEWFNNGGAIMMSSNEGNGDEIESNMQDINLVTECLEASNLEFVTHRCCNRNSNNNITTWLVTVRPVRD